ncbi:MAG: hypothetical protein LUP95_07310 [Euryarchaeota archaeon]|nr:hypothetical protein [Euryarchaeota archaeon]
MKNEGVDSIQRKIDPSYKKTPPISTTESAPPTNQAPGGRDDERGDDAEEPDPGHVAEFNGACCETHHLFPPGGIPSVPGSVNFQRVPTEHRHTQ